MTQPVWGGWSCAFVCNKLKECSYQFFQLSWGEHLFCGCLRLDHFLLIFNFIQTLLHFCIFLRVILRWRCCIGREYIFVVISFLQTIKFSWFVSNLGPSLFWFVLKDSVLFNSFVHLFEWSFSKVVPLWTDNSKRLLFLFLCLRLQYCCPLSLKFCVVYRKFNMRGNNSIHEFLGWTCRLFPTKRTVFTFIPIISSVSHAAASVAYHLKELVTKFIARSSVTSVFWESRDHRCVLSRKICCMLCQRPDFYILFVYYHHLLRSSGAVRCKQMLTHLVDHFKFFDAHGC